MKEEEVILARDIFHNLRNIETKKRPSKHYLLTVQEEINAEMREYEVDRLIQVAEELNLPNEVIYLAVNYMDRFLSTKAIRIDDFQLLAVTCLFIASKHEEWDGPTIRLFRDVIVNPTNSEEDMLKMEAEILNMLNFEISPDCHVVLEWANICRSRMQCVHGQLHCRALAS